MLNHPSELLPLFQRLLPGSFTFEFSKYVYKPQSTIDERELVHISCEQAEAFLPELMQSLNPQQELALHSRIILAQKEYFYFPMLDLLGKFEPWMIPALEGLMREFKIPQFAIYDSGRSGHVYGIHLLNQDQLIKFFSRALLLNLPGKDPMIDTRWIGHRIYAGYGSLRWSCNTKQYLAFPTKVGIFTTK